MPSRSSSTFPDEDSEPAGAQDDAGVDSQIVVVLIARQSCVRRDNNIAIAAVPKIGDELRLLAGIEPAER